MVQKLLELLDLYSGAGGSAKGYQEAGFCVTGVDIINQPRYCGDDFIQMDAIKFLLAYGHLFDIIHASPPCKSHTNLRHLHPSTYQQPDNEIERLRAVLVDLGKPYIIENVYGAPLKCPYRLCGLMFGLPIYRHRYFESNYFLLTPVHPKHRRTDQVLTVVGHAFQADEGRDSMGIDWMIREELSQAIPPAYTEWIGRKLIISLKEWGVI